MCDPFQSFNVVGEISAKLPGGIYKVILSDGNEVTQKGVYEREMVLLKKSCYNHDAETSDIRNQDDLFNALSDYAMRLRRKVYRNKRRRTDSSRNDTSGMFSKYCIALDCGFLAELYQGQNEEKQKNYHEKHLELVDQLKEDGFNFFMYGTVHWERKNKVCLSDDLLQYLLRDEENSAEHLCSDCFNDTSVYCDHPCCKQKAKDFAERCNVKLKPSVVSNIVPKVKPGQKENSNKPKASGKRKKSCEEPVQIISGGSTSGTTITPVKVYGATTPVRMCEATITGSTYILDRSSRSDFKVEHPVQPVINFSRSSTASLSSGSNVLLENCQDIASSHKPLERSSTLNDMSVFNMPSSYQNCMVHIVKSTSVASTLPDVQPLKKESHLTLSCQVKSFDVSCHNVVESVKCGAEQGAFSNANAGMDISKYPVVSSNLLINISAPNLIGKTCSSFKQMMPIPKSLKAISVVTLPSLSSAPHYVVEGLSSSNVYPYIQLVKIVNVSTSGQLTCSGPVKVVPIKSFPVFVGSTPALSSKVFQYEAHCGKEADSPSPDSSSSSGQLFKSAGCGIYTVTNNARVTATSASGMKSKKSYLQGLLSTNPTWCLSGSMCSLEQPPLSNQKPSEMFGIASCSAMSGTKLATSIQSSLLHPSLVSENAAIKKSEMPCKTFSARNKGRIDFHKPEQLVN